MSFQRERVMDFSEFMEKVASKLKDNVLLEMRDDASKKIAKMGAVTVRRELRHAGIRRSTETGTHLGRNDEQKAKREKWGSVLDTQKKFKENNDSAAMQMEVRAGISKERAHVGRFLDKGTVNNRKNWGRDSGAPVQATNWMTKARKVFDASASPIVKKALQKSLNKQINIHGKAVYKRKR